MLLEQTRTIIEAEQSIDDIKEALRKVEIVEEPGVFPYRDADIELEELKLSDIRPIALYIVQHALARQFALRADLLDMGHDTLHLNSALHISYKDQSVGLIPPIIEETGEGLCLMDGLHRSMMARSIGEKTIRVLHLTNINSAYPLTSYPNNWDEIRMYDTTPTDRSLKKRYRPGRHFFRDLSGLNGSQRREGGYDA